ncbi:hypothetical protein CVT25_013534 [Psilocybe cyanescens]|uniref:Uncharacterized protein n=1 Tax=Psilocybe cyanescens TaxID=93625 RepID=A0A409XSP0_PSICY|nr:hypothetical protein CVT25_013534 [Psilocybe cyanescens]
MPIHPAIKFAILLPILGAFWEYLLSPYLELAVYERKIYPVNNEYCKKVPQLAACEKLILHQESGLLYLACSNALSRVQWTPAVGRLNASGASRDDFVATYDPKTSTITRLKIQDFESARGLSLHGMDVVESSSKPSELFVYLVNHRAPLGGLLAKDVGADSVIEIFKTTLGGNTMTHIKTMQDPVIYTPNDIVGSPDGKSFYFTNDHGSKVGFVRELDSLGRKTTSVGYCHVESGCHYAIQNMHGNNGIARAANGTFYVANCQKGGLTILEEQADNTLVLTDSVPADRAMDNLYVDSKGFVWAAAFPDVVKLVKKHFANPSIPSPSSALRFSINPNYNNATPSFRARYQVETLFEDDGSVASGITSAVYDAERNLLFLDGLASPNLIPPHISRLHTNFMLNNAGCSSPDYRYQYYHLWNAFKMGKLVTVALNLLVVLLAIAIGLWQIFLKPLFATHGVYPEREINPLGNKDCKAVPELEACEKIILHQGTGVIYLACSTQTSRAHWTPAMNQLNATGASREDYVATYDPSTSQITRLHPSSDFNHGRGLSLHGMDVVPSSSDPNVLYVYLVNHRTPLDASPLVPARKTGADSVIEIFKTTVGGKTLEHVKTMQHPIIITPNDVVGSADGDSFYFTNDHGVRVGYARYLDYIGHKNASVGYCHLDQGCKFARSKTHSSNGITRAANGTVYVADSLFGGVTVLEGQVDNTLVVVDSIITELVIDNLAVDADGQLWAAAVPRGLLAKKHMANPSLVSPSSVYRISINTGVNAFYGEKYRVEKVFEDDGKLVSGITSAVYDSRRKKLFLHGKHLSG